MGDLGRFISEHTWISIIVIVGSFIVVLTTIEQVSKCVRKRSFEQSRREIAAYVAEGTISPDQAATLLTVSGPVSKAQNAGRKLAQALAWDQVEKADARKLVEARAGADDEMWREMVDLVMDGMSADDAIKLVKSGSKSGPAAAPAGATPATA